MANTTFTGNVRANGDGSRNTRAGSMQMVANFHVPSTAAAAGTACQVSATDTSAVVLPNNCIVDKIVFKVIKGELPRLNSVKSGAKDVKLTRDGKTASQAKKDSNLQVLTELVGGTTTIEFNTSRPPLNDIRVRKALAHAVNRRADLKASNEGFGIPSTDWFGPDSKWYCGGKTGYP